MFLWTVLLIVLMSAIAYVAGRSRATGLVVADGPRLRMPRRRLPCPRSGPAGRHWWLGPGPLPCRRSPRAWSPAFPVQQRALAAGHTTGLPDPADDDDALVLQQRVQRRRGAMQDQRDRIASEVAFEIAHDLVLPRRVKVIAQSNFNTRKGEPACITAHLALMTWPKDQVERVYGPLDTDEYVELMRGADAILIPYSPANYGARSSGVFAEALRAGREQEPQLLERRCSPVRRYAAVLACGGRAA